MLLARHARLSIRAATWGAHAIAGAPSLRALSARRYSQQARIDADTAAQPMPASRRVDAPPPPEGGTHTPHRLSGDALAADWVTALAPELEAARAFRPSGNAAPPRILVLYGSLRKRAFSRLLAYEFARILELLGCDVRVYDPHGLPMKDDSSEAHPKVAELRGLSEWSEGHVWVSPEMHGAISGVFKNQIDWIPLSLGSVRPTQGRTVCLAQVNGGSQSFNGVNTLRLLARWMRMNVVTNQSSIAKAWTEFGDDDRLKPGGFRDRVVDVAEEMYKYTMLLRDHADFLVDRYSERRERAEKGRLLSQAEKEREKAEAAKAAAAAASSGA